MEMPKPTEAHKRMAKLAGKWKGKEHMYPSPWDPAGGPAIGTCENRMALDGFALLHDYAQERNGVVNFTGHGVLTYNAQEQCYVMHWWDSMGFGANVYKGNFSGDTLVMTHSMPHGQGRVSWKFPDDRSYQFRMEMSQDGKQWHPAMDGDYVRAG
jgi:hypothetical protein